MPVSRRSARLPFLLALAGAVLWWGAAAWRESKRSADVLAYTVCPFRGDARVVMQAGIAAADSLPVRVHEETHVEQCRTMGPIRYRLRNLTAAGKLALETPAYCEAARARLGVRPDTIYVRARLAADMIAAFDGIVDSSAVVAAIAATCPLRSGARH
jgi:hypothetical protein